MQTNIPHAVPAACLVPLFFLLLLLPSCLCMLDQSNCSQVVVWSGNVTLSESIFIDNSTCLQVNPGTIVSISSKNATSGGVNHVNIIVEGLLSLEGLEEAPITFQSVVIKNSWSIIIPENSIMYKTLNVFSVRHVKFIKGSDGYKDNFVIEKSSIHSEHPIQYVFDNVYMYGGDRGIVISGGNSKNSTNIFENSQNNFISLQIQNSEFINLERAIHLDGTRTSNVFTIDRLDITNCSFYATHRALHTPQGNLRINNILIDGMSAKRCSGIVIDVGMKETITKVVNSDFDNTMYTITAPKVIVDNSVFKNFYSAIEVSDSIILTNSIFQQSSRGSNYAIYLSENGLLSNVQIDNNVFTNIVGYVLLGEILSIQSFTFSRNVVMMCKPDINLISLVSPNISDITFSNNKIFNNKFLLYLTGTLISFEIAQYSTLYIIGNEFIGNEARVIVDVYFKGERAMAEITQNIWQNNSTGTSKIIDTKYELSLLTDIKTREDYNVSYNYWATNVDLLKDKSLVELYEIIKRKVVVGSGATISPFFLTSNTSDRSPSNLGFVELNPTDSYKLTVEQAILLVFGIFVVLTLITFISVVIYVKCRKYWCSKYTTLF